MVVDVSGSDRVNPFSMFDDFGGFTFQFQSNIAHVIYSAGDFEYHVFFLSHLHLGVFRGSYPF